MSMTEKVPVARAANRPRVLELVRSLEKGGRTVRLLDGAASLSRRGFDMAIASFSPPDGGARQRAAGLGLLLTLDGREGLDPTAVLRVWRLLRAHRIDLLHAHSEDAYLYGGLAARLAGIPAIGTFHRSTVSSYRASPSNRLVHRLLAHQVAVSEDRRQLMTRLTGAPSARVSVIPGAVDLARFRVVSEAEKRALRRRLEVPPAALMLLGLGHLGPIKGHDLTIHALAAVRGAFPAVRLYIGGTGAAAERQQLEGMIRDLDLAGSVVLLGQIQNPQDWLGACDLFVQPSRDEAFGLVFAEAAACGRAVLATRIGGIPEIVVDGQTGLLVPPDTPDELAAALRRLLAGADSRERLGRHARQRAERHFSVETMGAAYACLMARVLEDVNPRRWAALSHLHGDAPGAGESEPPGLASAPLANRALGHVPLESRT